MAERSGIDVSLASSMLEDARAALDEHRSSQGHGESDADEQEAVDVIGEGRDNTEQIRVVVGGDGRLTSVDIRQRAIREGSQALGPMVVEAVNAAREDRRAKLAEQRAGSVPSWDPGALMALQRDSAMRMTALVEQFKESMNKISRAGGATEE